MFQDKETREKRMMQSNKAIPWELWSQFSQTLSKDTDARWTTKNNERHFGYKNHVNADAATKLITKFTTSSASLHDSQALEEIVDQHDKRLFADSAYTGKTIQGYLNFKNVKTLFMKRAIVTLLLRSNKKNQTHLNQKYVPRSNTSSDLWPTLWIMDSISKQLANNASIQLLDY